MHILIDVQGLQSASKYRGIGRSTFSMSRAIIRNAGEHRVSILLNGMFSLENIRKVRRAYQDILPKSEIFTFISQGPVAAYNIANIERNRAAHINRDVAIAHISPDIIFVISFFEGHVDECVVSIPDYPVMWRTVCVCHDLIPLLNPETYLNDTNFCQFYINKLHEYKNADAIFAVSASTVKDIKKYTDIDSSRVINISSAVESKFCVLPLTPEQKRAFRQRYCLPDTFIMTLAMIEPRKNIEALIKAYSQLPKLLRNKYPLVLVCKMHSLELTRIQRLCMKCGLTSKQVFFTGYVPDCDLIILYNLCKLFIFPSLHEGFGFPPLEAMSCGAPTLSSNTSSLPELIGLPEAMFDPTSLQAMRDSIMHALADRDFYQRLQDHALKQAAKFSWDNTARLAFAGFEQVMIRQKLMSSVNVKQFTSESICRLAETVKLKLETDRLGMAWALAQNAFSEHMPRLWIDATMLMVQSNTALMIQMRQLISTLLTKKIPDYSVHVIYFLDDIGYRYAVVNLDGNLSSPNAQDLPVLFTRQDILLIVEPRSHVSTRQQAEFDNLIRVGTKVIFWFPEEIFAMKWLADQRKACLLNETGSHAMLRYADTIFFSSDSAVSELKHLREQWMDKFTINATFKVYNIKTNTLSITGDNIQQFISLLAL